MQSVPELLPLTFPSRILGLDALLDVAPLRFQIFRSFVVLPLRGVQRSLRLRDRLLSLGPLLLPGRLFLAVLGIAPPLLPLELSGGFPCILIADFRPIACLSSGGVTSRFGP